MPFMRFLLWWIGICRDFLCGASIIGFIFWLAHKDKPAVWWIEGTLLVLASVAILARKFRPNLSEAQRRDFDYLDSRR